MADAITRAAQGQNWRDACSSLLTSAKLAAAGLSHDLRRTWFTVSILMLAGVVAYVQLAATTAQLLSYGATERQATAEIVVLDRNAADNNRRGWDMRPLKPEVLAVIAASAGIEAYETLAERSVRISLPENVGRRNYLLATIVDPLPPALSAPLSLSDEAKQLLSLPSSLVLTEIDARATGLSLGSEVKLNGKSLRVVGLMRGGLGANGSMVSRQTAIGVRRSAPGGGAPRPTTVLVKPAHGVTTDQLVRELDTALAPLGAAAISREQLVRNISDRILEERSDIRGFLVIALFMAAVTIVIVLQATNSSIAAQRAEFAILLALGVPRWGLASIILQQAAWLGVLSAAFAISGALVAQVFLTYFDVAMAMQTSFVPPVTGLLIGSTVVGGLIALPGALTIKPVDLLR